MSGVSRADLSARYDLLVREVIAPPLAAAGFRRRSAAFIKQTPQSWQAIIVQRRGRLFGRPRAAGEIHFTADAALAIRDLLRFDGKNPMMQPKWADWHWIGRVGALLPTRYDRWWTMTADMSEEQCTAIGDEFANTLLDHVLPWLDRVATVAGYREFLLHDRGELTDREQSWLQMLS